MLLIGYVSVSRKMRQQAECTRHASSGDDGDLII